MSSVARRHIETRVPADPEMQPDPPLVKTNRQRFQWESAVLRATKSMQREATAVAFYLSKAWREKLGYCFPPIDAIASDLGISQTTVWRSLQCLSQLGLLIIKKGKRRGAKHSHSVYYLTVQTGALFQHNSLINQESNMAEQPIGHYAVLHSGSDQELGDIPTISNEAENQPPTMPFGISTTMPNGIDNQRMELQGEPHGSPLIVMIICR